MKKRFLILIAIILFLVFIMIFSFKSFNHHKFKKEYESLNNKNYRNITISKNNPFIYSSDSSILKKIKKKESFIVYFGANWCPWCRSVLESAIEVAKENKVDTIYYVDITGIRDEYKLVGNIPELKKEGSKSYYELIKKFDNVLNDYIIEEENEKINIGEKRIFAPSFIKVEKGKSVKISSGISKYQKDPNMKLNEKIKKDIKNNLKNVIK